MKEGRKSSDRMNLVEGRGCPSVAISENCSFQTNTPWSPTPPHSYSLLSRTEFRGLPGLKDPLIFPMQKSLSFSRISVGSTPSRGASLSREAEEHRADQLSLPGREPLASEALWAMEKSWTHQGDLSSLRSKTTALGGIGRGVRDKDRRCGKRFRKAGALVAEPGQQPPHGSPWHPLPLECPGIPLGTPDL